MSSLVDAIRAHVKSDPLGTAWSVFVVLFAIGIVLILALSNKKDSSPVNKPSAAPNAAAVTGAILKKPMSQTQSGIVVAPGNKLPSTSGFTAPYSTKEMMTNENLSLNKLYF